MTDDGLPAARARVREAFGVHGWNPSSLLIEAIARAAREDYGDLVASVAALRADVAETVREARAAELDSLQRDMESPDWDHKDDWGVPAIYPHAVQSRTAAIRAGEA